MRDLVDESFDSDPTKPSSVHRCARLGRLHCKWCGAGACKAGWTVPSITIPKTISRNVLFFSGAGVNVLCSYNKNWVL